MDIQRFVNRRNRFFDQMADGVPFLLLGLSSVEMQTRIRLIDQIQTSIF